jgi:hypothetical protein
MVHNIIVHHLEQHLNGESPLQCLMIVHSQSRTGKSELLNAISQVFAARGVSSLLAKTAMFGVAASIIGSQALHSWTVLPVHAPHSDKWAKEPVKEVEARRKLNIGCTLWLTMDKKSMMTTMQLAWLSEVTSIVCGTVNTSHASCPFDGLSIILFGNFHQCKQNELKADTYGCMLLNTHGMSYCLWLVHRRQGHMHCPQNLNDEVCQLA